MRKTILCVVIGIFILNVFFLFNSTFHTNLMRFLNQDVLYLKNGDVIRGWIWDEKGGVLVGETKSGVIFVSNDKECIRIERNNFLCLLRGLI